MPLFYQKNINQHTKLAIWKIEEEEIFFHHVAIAQREITHAHKRLQHLAGRYLLQFLYPSFPYNEIEITNTKKPFLSNKNLHFSISHCGNYAASIVSTTHNVGIDIEISTEKIYALANKFLHQEEISSHQINIHAPTEGLVNYLTLLWSCKEAVFKWWGKGSVNFSEMICIEPFTYADNGVVQVYFKQQLLLLEYIVFDNLCLVWVITE
ncbi:MAG: 4'-phosphopantetheinyl transferase superfamily protein [Chitinophagaceae bacterium]|nr:4'-phosphopantetheinyl transferase superfamily protein [Chitinophagaceae bacterium]MCW5905439.1 4'-phosphopantetheinyl transferase superfamily protein [Chitinophagaceae bacterium]